jgi:myosin-1
MAYQSLSRFLIWINVGKNEKAAFADVVQKFDRKFKPSPREFLITDNAVILIGAEKEKNGPNKGKFVKVIKRKIPFKDIGSVSLRWVLKNTICASMD